MSSLLPPGDSLQFSSFRALLEDSSDDLGPLHSTALDVAFTSSTSASTSATTATTDTSCSGPSETSLCRDDAMYAYIGE